jgi:hypothetical protein
VTSNSIANEGTTGSYPHGEGSVAREDRLEEGRWEEEEATAVGDERRILGEVSSIDVMYLWASSLMTIGSYAPPSAL